MYGVLVHIQTARCILTENFYKILCYIFWLYNLKISYLHMSTFLKELPALSEKNSIFPHVVSKSANFYCKMALSVQQR